MYIRLTDKIRRKPDIQNGSDQNCHRTQSDPEDNSSIDSGHRLCHIIVIEWLVFHVVAIVISMIWEFVKSVPRHSRQGDHLAPCQVVCERRAS